MSTGSRPIHEMKLGRIRATIWSNVNERQEPWFNVSIARSFREDGQWRTSTSFGRDDLPLVAKAADVAYTWIWNRKGDSNVGP